MKKIINCIGCLSTVTLFLLVCLFVWSRGKRADFDMLSAAAHGDNNRIQILLREGVKPNVTGILRVTPLMRAAMKGHADTAKMLLDSGADINATDSVGNSALMEAVRNGHADVVKLLIARGANVNQKTGASTALSLVSARRDDHSIDDETYRAIVKMLADAGARQ